MCIRISMCMFMPIAIAIASPSPSLSPLHTYTHTSPTPLCVPFASLRCPCRAVHFPSLVLAPRAGPRPRSSSFCSTHHRIPTPCLHHSERLQLLAEIQADRCCRGDTAGAIRISSSPILHPALPLVRISSIVAASLVLPFPSVCASSSPAMRASVNRPPTPDGEEDRDPEPTLQEIINIKLIESGEKERLKELLRERLIECGWRDELKAQCRAFTRKKGRNNITVDELVRTITPKGRAMVPDNVKAELLQRIRAFLLTDPA